MTSTRKEPLPFKAMHEEREYFRAMHSALLQAPDMLRSDTVYTEQGIRIDYDGTVYTLTDGQSIVRTENPLQTAVKYAEATRKAVKPKKRAYRKHNEADEKHYIATNGTPTLLSQEDNADLFIAPTKSMDTETMNEANQAKAQIELQASQEKERIERDMKLAAAHNAAVDAESQAVKDNAAVDTERKQQQRALLAQAVKIDTERKQADRIQEQQTLKPVKPAKQSTVKSTPTPKQPAKSEATMQTANIADLASQYDVSQPATKADNIMSVYDIASVSRELTALQAINSQFDVTSESKERVKLADLDSQYQVSQDAAETVTAQDSASYTPTTSQKALNAISQLVILLTTILSFTAKTAPTAAVVFLSFISRHWYSVTIGSVILVALGLPTV